MLGSLYFYDFFISELRRIFPPNHLNRFPAFSYFLSRLLDDDETNILDASGMLLSLVNSPTLDLTQVLPHVDAAEKILSVLSNCGPFSQEVLVNLSKIFLLFT